MSTWHYRHTYRNIISTALRVAAQQYWSRVTPSRSRDGEVVIREKMAARRRAIERIRIYTHMHTHMCRARWKKKGKKKQIHRDRLTVAVRGDFCWVPVSSHVFKYYISLLVNTRGGDTRGEDRGYTRQIGRGMIQPEERTPVFSLMSPSAG